MSQNAPQVYVITLAEDRARQEALTEQFRTLDYFKVNFVAGVLGRSLSDLVCVSLVDNKAWAKHKGTIGCFLGHVNAWENLANSADEGAIILEDDVDVLGLSAFRELEIPEDAEIVFLNDRMCQSEKGQPVHVTGMISSLKKLDEIHGGPGGDGYFLKRESAVKLLEACRTDLFYGHVDGRLLRYASAESDIEALANTWIADIVLNHHHATRKPKLGLLKGYSCSLPMVRHKGVASSREQQDGTHSVLAAFDPKKQSKRNRQASADEIVPIRYWNRVRNIGDSINPYVIEQVSGARPVYSNNDNAEHILGIGSIFFMATKHSHIWGSGILDPKAPLPELDPKKIHAVRGKLTFELLKQTHKFDHEPAFGDPGMLLGSLESTQDFIRESQVKFKYAIIPHFRFLDNTYIRELANSPDARLLSPHTENLDFIKAMIESEIVISQSLHGVIFAQALGKPYVWLTHTDDEIWQFKFHDWLSNTSDTRKPATFGQPIESLVSSAEVIERLASDEKLLEAFPSVRASKPGTHIGFREGRAKSPLYIRVTREKPHMLEDWDYTVTLTSGSEEELRTKLNVFGNQCDDHYFSCLVGNKDLLSRLTKRHIDKARSLLESNATLHYVSFSARSTDPSADPAAEKSKPSIDDMPESVIFARHLINFSFNAPGAPLDFD